jgi:hypothetical protein
VLAHRVLLDPYSTDGESASGPQLLERCLELAPRPGIALATD